MIDRINELIGYLKKTRKILSQAEFAEKIGIKPSQISEMLSNKRTISTRTIHKISQSFPFVSENWLINGEGQMLEENSGNVIENVIVGNDNYTTSENRNVTGEVSGLIKLLENKDLQITEVIGLIKNKDFQINKTFELIDSKDKQIDRLLAIIETKKDNN